LSNNDEGVAKLVAKRYQAYLKEQEWEKRHSEWIRSIVAAMLWLMKLITNTLEKGNIKKKRIIEKVPIE
jgi:uncharacterized membrane protein